MNFPNLAASSVSLRGIFWLYACKDGSGASLADLLDLVVLFIVCLIPQNVYTFNISGQYWVLPIEYYRVDIWGFFKRPELEMVK